MSRKVAFACTIFLTLLSLGACVVLAFSCGSNPTVTPLIETFATTWKMGFGAVLGLVGGRYAKNET